MSSIKWKGCRKYIKLCFQRVIKNIIAWKAIALNPTEQKVPLWCSLLIKKGLLWRTNNGPVCQIMNRDFHFFIFLKSFPRPPLMQELKEEPERVCVCSSSIPNRCISRVWTRLTGTISCSGLDVWQSGCCSAAQVSDKHGQTCLVLNSHVTHIQMAWQTGLWSKGINTLEGFKGGINWVTRCKQKARRIYFLILLLNAKSLCFATFWVELFGYVSVKSNTSTNLNWKTEAGF